MTDPMPTLTGSPAEIGWARVIRSRRMVEANEFLRENDETARIIESPRATQRAVRRREALDRLMSETDSLFWIDTRNQKLLFLVLAKENERR